MRDDPLPSAEPNPNKKLINLHLGDPSLGVLKPPPSALSALKRLTSNDIYGGIHQNYGHTKGIEEIRTVLAEHLSQELNQQIPTDDVILTSGCQHALQLCTLSLCDSGTNVLVPSPGYPVEQVFLKPNKVEARYYRLDLKSSGEHRLDLKHIDSLIDTDTSAFVLNNPSNPTGAVYPKEHLEELCKILENRKVPVISDELYGPLVFGERFHSMINVRPRIPTLICNAISKRYLVPGWRLGWILLSDRDGALSNVWNRLSSMAHYINGPCRLAQATLETLLKETPPSYFDELNGHISTSADIVTKELSSCDQLTLVKPKGGTFYIVFVNEKFFGDKKMRPEKIVEQFIVGLIEEQSVTVHPGVALNCPGAIRIHLKV